MLDVLFPSIEARVPLVVPLPEFVMRLTSDCRPLPRRDPNYFRAPVCRVAGREMVLHRPRSPVEFRALLDDDARELRGVFRITTLARVLLVCWVVLWVAMLVDSLFPHPGRAAPPPPIWMNGFFLASAVWLVWLVGRLVSTRRSPDIRLIEEALTRAASAPAASAPSVGVHEAPYKGLKLHLGIVYQGDEVLRERIPDEQAMFSFWKNAQTICEEHFDGADQPEVLDVVIVVKPGWQARVWFVSPTRPEDDPSLRELARRIEAVDAPEVLFGPVAYAMQVAIGGAVRKLPTTDADFAAFRFPAPPEWRRVQFDDPENAVIPDDVIKVIWPDP